MPPAIEAVAIAVTKNIVGLSFTASSWVWNRVINVDDRQSSGSLSADCLFQGNLTLDAHSDVRNICRFIRNKEGTIM
jgi:hypothetical protein